MPSGRDHSELLQSIAIVRDAWAPRYQNIQRFHQARLVRITHGRLAIRLDPFGVLNPKVVMNLFPQVCVRIELVKHTNGPCVISVTQPSREPLK